MQNNNDISIKTKKTREYQEISFIGKLVYGNTQEAKKQIQPQLEEAKGYIFDMNNIEYIDSTGLGLLMNLAKQLNMSKRKITLVIKDEFIKQIFYIAKFNLIFPIVSTRDEALAVLENNMQSSLSIEEY